MRISDWSSDVCSSDLLAVVEDAAVIVEAAGPVGHRAFVKVELLEKGFEPAFFVADDMDDRARQIVDRRPLDPSRGGGASRRPMFQIGRASCRERVCPYV